MRFEVSDLLFPGFVRGAFADLDKSYGIEFFYEFGKDYYWNQAVAEWGERSFSIHAPCVTLNLADPAQKNYTRILEKTFAYAQKIHAGFVVVHTNELFEGNKETVQSRVIRRLRQVISLGQSYGIQVLIENVGLRTKGNVLFDLPEYMALFDIFPQAQALLDTGHAHVNGWDLAAVVAALGKRLYACHIHDNDGNGDAHLPIGQGNIDWKSYFSAVKKHAPQAVQVCEYCCGFKNARELETHISELKTRYKLEK